VSPEGSGVDTRPFLIGLTGPIGCGKSTISRWLANLGGYVIDADAIARAASGPGEPTLPAIRARFGDPVFASDGSLDRAALARVVFSDSDALRDLESILHPEVRRRLLAELTSTAASDAPFAVVEAIKLVEGGLAGECDEVWLVDCTPVVQRERLIRRGLPEEDIERRVSAQGSDLAERLGPSATRRIETSGSEEDTRRQVEEALADALAPAFGLPIGWEPRLPS
jgi:dephospho-CoA kinase